MIPLERIKTTVSGEQVLSEDMDEDGPGLAAQMAFQLFGTDFFSDEI